jgi:alternate signal-mediated exported protein
MNKMVKGSVAGATGIVLLMGGFGTYALWSDTATAEGGSVTSGVLDIVSAGPATWRDLSSDSSVRSWTPASDLMVPGDVVEMRQPLDVAATGKNLKAKLTVTGGVGSTLQNIQVTANYGGQTISSSNGSFAFTWDTADEIKALDVAEAAVVTITFPTGVANQVDQNKTLDLSDVSLLLEQVR